ncbi:phenol degradation protein meta [Burkholderia cenocepacia]|nr:transporter [Burkholderia cenocepacia]RQU22999.1 phenol degradation protein meta [Burkholderia cenocepacia]RQU46134.1 phenol degradation protein meta [Burkholderia cenocepacia]RQU73738.1 phenol degradation protein meta [Burkholderia cenocepacia]RQU97054.1 phenol degradation protein meta [Burkholderia cenocepacia]RQV33653.1 phenol degradation protein meta [Burkholderia cenocepacia]
MISKTKFIATAIALSSTLLCGNTHATENGLATYPIGVNTVLDGILPPPGATQFYNYNQYYVANKFAGPDGKSIVPGFRIDAFVEAPRVVHTWGATLGPLSFSSGIVVPIFHLNLRTPGGSGTRTALGDIIIHPLFVGYHNEAHTLFIAISPDIGLPTGAYSTNRTANTGLNTYALMPNINVTWFPSPKWEISSTAQIEFNSPNHATNYHSGNVATLDYGIGYSVMKDLQVGVQGFFLQQISDDTVNGVSVNGNGFRGRAYGIGPQIRYNWSPFSGVVLKYQHEFNVRNRPQGDKLWLQVSFPI